MDIFTRGLQDSIALREQLLANSALLAQVRGISDDIVRAFRGGHQVFFCGNGGSAADAQHLAGELSGRYYYDRPPLAALALNSDPAYLTAVANDYSFGEIYARLVRGYGKPGDILVGLSTSGNSKNVVEAFKSAREMGIATVGFTGETGGELKLFADKLIAIPSKDTPRIQECHMLLGHSICEQVEAEMFPRT